MQGQFISYNASSFHYRVFGNGPKLLFCFHGYGRDGHTFEFLKKQLGSQYTIVALDAPHHGNTEWDDPEFHPKDLVKVVNDIRASLKKESGKISLLGFSMGGRIALHVTQLLAPQIERIVLLAPDGLKYKSWLWLTTHTWVGGWLFDYIVHRPNGLLRLTRFSLKSGMISKGLSNFVRYYLEDKEERFVLYRRWKIMRKFSPQLSSLRNVITTNNIKVRMLFGKYDRVIHYESGHRFLRKMEEYATVKIIDAGHDLLREGHGDTISELFKD